MEIYDQAVGMNPFEAQTALLGLVALLVASVVVEAYPVPSIGW